MGYMGIFLQCTQSHSLSTLGPLGDGLLAIWGFPTVGVPTIMENQMEKHMEHEIETGFM